MSAPACADPSTDDVLLALAGFLRPRLRDDVPVMWRSESAIQIGEDVVIDRVSRSHVAWLSSLDGLHSPTMIAESLMEGDCRRTNDSSRSRSPRSPNFPSCTAR